MEAETGIPALDTVLVWGGAISLSAGLLTLGWRLVRGLVRLGRRVEHVMDDWQGEEARPGVAARPGVMERMAGLEGRMGGVEEDLRRIRHELYPNSGGSLRDAVDLANRRLALLCPEEPTDRRGTDVPPGDRRGDNRPEPGDADGWTPDVTSGDTSGDNPGDTGGQ